MDPRATAARLAHRAAVDADRQGASAREQRGQLVRQLRAEDPARWTYDALAGAVGCSQELIAAIVKGRR